MHQKSPNILRNCFYLRLLAAQNDLVKWSSQVQIPLLQKIFYPHALYIDASKHIQLTQFFFQIFSDSSNIEQNCSKFKFSSHAADITMKNRQYTE